MKIVYHVTPEGMPDDFKEQMGWLIEHGDEKADEMVARMNQDGSDQAVASLLEAYIEVVSKLAFGALPYPAAQLVVEVDVRGAA